MHTYCGLTVHILGTYFYRIYFVTTQGSKQKGGVRRFWFGWLAVRITKRRLCHSILLLQILNAPGGL